MLGSVGGSWQARGTGPSRLHLSSFDALATVTSGRGLTKRQSLLKSGLLRTLGVSRSFKYGHGK